MIETHRLKNVVIFVQTILRFVLSRKIINIFNIDIGQAFRIYLSQNNFSYYLFSEQFA